jgi:hypothetical protein
MQKLSRLTRGVHHVLVASLLGLGIPGCVRTITVRVRNFLTVRVLVKRAAAPGDVYDIRRDIGWVEPGAETNLPGSVALGSASYRLRAFTPDGRLIAEFNETHDSLNTKLRNNIWRIEIRKPDSPARKTLSHHK